LDIAAAHRLLNINICTRIMIIHHLLVITMEQLLYFVLLSP